MKNKIIILISMLVLVVSGFCVWFFGFHMPEVRNEKERQQLVKEYYENKLNLYREENELYEDYEVEVAFIGDSLTDGYDLKKYYPDYLVSNRGIGGETTHGLEERLEVSVYDLKPKVVVMLIGGNNLKTMFENYEDILIGLKENLPNTKVVLLSLTAMGQDWAHKNEIACYNNAKIKLLADKYNYTFVDLYTHLFNLETNELYSEYTTDGAHFTAKGYEVVTEVVKPVLDDILNSN